MAEIWNCGESEQKIKLKWRQGCDLWKWAHCFPRNSALVSLISNFFIGMHGRGLQNDRAEAKPFSGKISVCQKRYLLKKSCQSSIWVINLKVAKHRIRLSTDFVFFIGLYSTGTQSRPSLFLWKHNPWASPAQTHFSARAEIWMRLH